MYFTPTLDLPGYIEHWARGHTFSQSFCRPFKGVCLPAATAFDVLIVMGGPQSPLAIEDAPYLSREIDLVSQALCLDVPVLGFCLGAQLIAEALVCALRAAQARRSASFPSTSHRKAAGILCYRAFRPDLQWPTGT